MKPRTHFQTRHILIFIFLLMTELSPEQKWSVIYASVNECIYKEKFIVHKMKLMSWCVAQNIYSLKTRQIWGIWKLRPAYSPETPNMGQNRWCFVPCDLEIWWMTLKNNRESFLCCFKLCATFHSHRWIQTGVTVRKCPIWVKLDDF